MKNETNGHLQLIQTLQKLHPEFKTQLESIMQIIKDPQTEFFKRSVKRKLIEFYEVSPTVDKFNNILNDTVMELQKVEEFLFDEKISVITEKVLERFIFDLSRIEDRILLEDALKANSNANYIVRCNGHFDYNEPIEFLCKQFHLDDVNMKEYLEYWLPATYYISLNELKQIIESFYDLPQTVFEVEPKNNITFTQMSPSIVGTSIYSNGTRKDADYVKVILNIPKEHKLHSILDYTKSEWLKEHPDAKPLISRNGKFYGNFFVDSVNRMNDVVKSVITHVYFEHSTHEFCEIDLGIGSTEEEECAMIKVEEYLTETEQKQLIDYAYAVLKEDLSKCTKTSKWVYDHAVRKEIREKADENTSIWKL
ncbi:hypothetical protein [Faecalimonas sp.]